MKTYTATFRTAAQSVRQRVEARCVPARVNESQGLCIIQDLCTTSKELNSKGFSGA
jgi:hypothetical protein